MAMCVSYGTKKYFDKKMVMAQKAAKKKDWERFKNIFKENKEKLFEPFDMFGNTAIHAVARLGNSKLLKELIEMLSETEQKVALRKPNDEGNTILHEAIFGRTKQDIETVDIIMKFDQKHQNEEPLLEIQNNTGETPMFRAARFGNLRMLKHIHDTHPFHPLQSKHFPPGFSGTERPILYTCAIGFHFDVAIWLLKNVDESLAREKYMNNCTCFHLLSKMGMAFRSKGILKLGTNEQIIYNLLPEWDDDGNNLMLRSTTDIERGQLDDETENPSKLKIAVFSRINYAFWKLLAKGFGSIDEIWKQKKRHMFAEHLAKLLVNSDDSWLKSDNKNDKLLVVLPDFPSNVTEKKKEIELTLKLKTKKEINEQIENKVDSLNVKEQKEWETPLFLAAASGNLEVVKIIVNEHPEAISHVNKDGLNILFMAVKHRQLEIYEFIEESGAFMSLVARITRKHCYSILHQAASMEYYREPELPGVANQLQHELEWYHRVKSNIPEHYLMHCDKGGLTAGDLLDIEHAVMHDEAKQWMKETAQSCSTVAVLIAGVVFAAAYAIPGGTEGGTPILHTSNVFHVFTIMDVVSLACSLGSVVMFLSILTSSFDLWDFHKSLPQKLKIGFIMLFFSLICTMIAFAATILLTIRMEGNKKTTTLAYSLAIVIVSIFGLKQFPFTKMILDFKQSLKSLVKVGGRKKGARY